MFSDTIFALSSGRLPSGIAIVRVSGNLCRFVCETMAGSVPKPRTASLCPLSARDGRLLDNGLVLWFPAPQSFTGEDCLELHLHGGVAVVKAVLEELSTIAGLRAAEPGEFTRRAFINGKMDLVQAEALADLISAETEAQRRFAVLNADGRQSALYESWRQRLLTARAAIEAQLDFSDERDVPEAIEASLIDDLAELANEMNSHCRGYRQAELIRDGFDIVIAGAPNAGKSSLINALAKRDVAIVSPEAGTTRDLIEVNLDLDGYRVRVTDTAGLRATDQQVEKIGVERARSRIASADLLLLLTDISAPESKDDGFAQVVSAADVIRVGTKCDLTQVSDPKTDLLISTLNGEGITELLRMISRRVEAAAGTSVDIIPSRLRHVGLIQEAAGHLGRATDPALAQELRAESLRMASNALGRVTGQIDVEDILGSIFSQFCIGK